MMILIVLTSVVFLVAVAVLAMVVAGIRAEERHMTLTCGPERPRTLASAVSRRILGVHIRRPQKAPDGESEDAARFSKVGGR
jgi:hypothetical protein